MTDYVTPCQGANADDWFIGRDGRQYADDELIPAERLLEFKADITKTVRMSGLTDDEIVEVIDHDITEAEDEIRRAALIRRRHARDACHNECRLRLQCLTKAIEGREFYGTWAGYYEEQLRDIIRLRDERASRVGE